MNVEVLNAAREELMDSAARYELAVDGLGMELLDEAERVLDMLSDHPELGQAGTYSVPDIRRFPMRRFPYKVVYAIREARVLVLAFAGDRQAPEYWRERA